MTVGFVHPETLEEGKIYLYCRQSKNKAEQSPVTITVLAYDNCPALVIVRDQYGKRWRCLRDEIFIAGLE